MNVRASIIAVCIALLTVHTAWGQRWSIILPEQRRIKVRDPSALPHARIPALPPPETVDFRPPGVPQWQLSLDEAIGVALANTEVVRVLTGVAATSSGRTIYDPAIVNSGIDEAQGVFDPAIDAQNNFNRFDPPRGEFDPTDPSRALIRGTTTSNYDLRAGVTKKTVTGGDLRMGVNTNPSRSRSGTLPLNPNNRSSIDLSYTQPLLQGAGPRFNRAPIVLARIDTERSYFQFKDSVQELIRGVIDAYWRLVFARTDVWAREQQVEQGQEALNLAQARLDTGHADLSEVTQARTAYEGFRSQLIAARANQLQTEAALANILGLPPSGLPKVVPITSPTTSRFEFDWPAIIVIAEERRPDIVELKLILEADQQLLLQARNRALPRVDASMLYRWNGLSGRMPSGTSIAASGGDFADWTLGVNFSVPLGLRTERASMRRQQISIARDRANLQQGVHNATHTLAINLRNLAQFYQQYQASTRLRTAARENLLVQWHKYREGLQDALFLDVLQSITAWGNAVSSQAQSLTQYNTELANLERQTGTVLETHGVRFFEERYASLGPLGRLFPDQYYPRDMRIGPNGERYPVGNRPAEESFNLEPPVTRGRPARTEDVNGQQTPDYGLPDPNFTPPPREPIPPPQSRRAPGGSRLRIR